MDVLVRALAGAAAKLHTNNTNGFDAIMTAALPDLDAVTASIDRLATELGVPRWFVRRNISVYTCFADGRVYTAVDFNEKTGARKFADPEVAMRLVARHIQLEDYNESFFRDAAGKPAFDRLKPHWRACGEWKSEVLAAAPEFWTTGRQDLRPDNAWA